MLHQLRFSCVLDAVVFAVHELGFLATRVDVAICANVMDFCVRRQPTISVFLSFSWDLCPERFLSRTRSVGTCYECHTHGTLGKSDIITFIHFGILFCFDFKWEEVPTCVYLFLFVCIFLFFCRSCKSLQFLKCNAVDIGICYGCKMFC